MSQQAELFDADRTTPTPCPVNGCGAIRFPGQDKVVTCACDLDRATSGYTGARPKLCLNAVDPRHQGIPY